MLGTRDLALYAAIVGTANGVWALFHAVIRDRARIVVRVTEAELISPGIDARLPILSIVVSNRGRRSIFIQSVSRVADPKTGGHQMSADILRDQQVPFRLDEGESKTLMHGAAGGYEHGGWSLKRWYVVDGAARIHPLRERYRQRIERVVFFLWRLAEKRRDRP